MFCELSNSKLDLCVIFCSEAIHRGMTGSSLTLWTFKMIQNLQLILNAKVHIQKSKIKARSKSISDLLSFDFIENQIKLQNVKQDPSSREISETSSAQKQKRSHSSKCRWCRHKNASASYHTWCISWNFNIFRVKNKVRNFTVFSGKKKTVFVIEKNCWHRFKLMQMDCYGSEVRWAYALMMKFHGEQKIWRLGRKQRKIIQDSSHLRSRFM